MSFPFTPSSVEGGAVSGNVRLFHYRCGILRHMKKIIAFVALALAGLIGKEMIKHIGY